MTPGTDRLLAIAEYGSVHATPVATSSPDHGPRHWRDVARIGYDLGVRNRADLAVVFAFAALHDTQRQSEFEDLEHGARAALLYAQGGKSRLPLDAWRTVLLNHALVHHDEGGVHNEPTVGTCWDADRLTIGRVGIHPDPQYFSTLNAGQEFDSYVEAAREIMAGPDQTWKEIARVYGDCA